MSSVNTKEEEEDDEDEEERGGGRGGGEKKPTSSSSLAQMESGQIIDLREPNVRGNIGAISSVQHTDTKMSAVSASEPLEGKTIRSPPEGATVAGGRLTPQSQSLRGAASTSGGERLNGGASGTVSGDSMSLSVDDLYQGWPTLGYNYPTSNEMWDFLDRTTWVDVKAQLGFHAKYSRPHAALFD